MICIYVYFDLSVNYTSQADSIVSKLQTMNNQEKDERPTILIAADTVCLDFVQLPTESPMFRRLPSMFRTSEDIFLKEVNYMFQ